LQIIISLANWIINFGIIEFFTLLLIFANILTFALYAVDKRRAENKKWRIPEKTLLFFTLAFGAFGAILAMRLVKHKTRKPKFRVAAVVGLIFSSILAVHLVQGLVFSQIIRYVEVEFRSANWNSALNGYKIAFMTDFHTITNESMREIILELNAKNIDLLLLGGDFSMRNEFYLQTLAEISQANPTDGIFGVEGNHDDYIRLFAAQTQNGIISLDNSGVQIHENFFVAGVHDLWNRTPNISTAIAAANEDDFVLLISHNPDLAMLQPTNEVDLILSGHTHGGQITFFGFPFYLLRGSITNYGTRFAGGFAESADGVSVYTSTGVGDYYGIPRIFAQREVVIFTLYAE